MATNHGLCDRPSPDSIESQEPRSRGAGIFVYQAVDPRSIPGHLPDDVGALLLEAEVMELARVSNEFSAKPVETLMGWIKKHGLEQQIGQALMVWSLF